MKESHIQKFNAAYQSSDCYYGEELRTEFTDYFWNRDIQKRQALDLGCGEGRYTLYLARKGCHVTAIDRTPEGIRKLKAIAEEKHLPVTASVEDIAEFVFPENRFDIIVAATVLDHLDDKTRGRAISGIKSALRPGGILYVNVFTVDDPGCLLKQSAGNDHPASGTREDVSDTASCMEYYFAPGELRSCFNSYAIFYYHEGVESDLSHGRPHHHGWACLLAGKPFTNQTA